MTDGTAKDFSVGVIVSVASAVGVWEHISSSSGIRQTERGTRSGDRYLGEAGAGLNVGPLGFQVAVKIAYNKLSDPRAHSFYTVPISLRGTLSF